MMGFLLWQNDRPNTLRPRVETNARGVFDDSMLEPTWKKCYFGSLVTATAPLYTQTSLKTMPCRVKLKPLKPDWKLDTPHAQSRRVRREASKRTTLNCRSPHIQWTTRSQGWGHDLLLIARSELTGNKSRMGERSCALKLCCCWERCTESCAFPTYRCNNSATTLTCP